LSQIDWLVCTTDPAATAAGSASEAFASEIEAAAEGCLEEEAPPSPWLLSVLSPAERATLAGKRYPKRRREWLLGRWTAKHLLRHACPEYASLPLSEITVGNDPDGAPYLAVEGHGRLALSLSISHRNDHAFCALLSPSSFVPAAQTVVGADIERVEPRDPAFVHDFFTAREAEHVWTAPDALRDTLVTVIWSAKEAVLKALHLGLTVDTRSVEIVHVAGIDTPPLDPWAPIQVCCTLPDIPPLSAWWRPHADYVLTLAAFSRVTVN